jgi:hypothetical protein
MRDFCERRLGLAATVALALIVLLSVLGLGVCGCSESSSGSSDGKSDGGATETDSSLKAYSEARASVSKAADDALLFSAGTPGLAFADVPDSWSFSFYSPGKNHIYRVAVDHGTAEAAQDMAEAQEGVTVAQAVDIESIKVGAAEAVKKARAFGEKSGKVPMNVSVTGLFAKTSEDAALNLAPGIWRVTFATGTDLADAQTYDVDMMTGDVTAVKE